jgi:phytoene dehydrogenase-like protein
MEPVVEGWEVLLPELLAPLRLPRRQLLRMVRFGCEAIWPAKTLASRRFVGERARALFAGLAAHSILPLEEPLSAAFGLVLGAAGHVSGWPVSRGGSQQIADALAVHLRALGGEIIAGHTVESLDDLPPAGAVLLDVTPRQLLHIAGRHLPVRYRRKLERYRYGPGAFKVDWALDGPIPWRASECRRAGTIHVGGTLDEIAASERGVWEDRHPEQPFVLLAQQSLFDPTRAPDGYGSDTDMTERIEAQIERFAPGFRQCILARSTMSAADLEGYNSNYIGGDITGGVQDLRQLYSRPVLSRFPYRTPVEGLYLCSSSTPPGGGVHGMCGYHAANAALRKLD